VKWAARADSAMVLPALLAEAWRQALAPPSGPVFVEIPVDILAGETDASVGVGTEYVPAADIGADVIREAARLLNEAKRPVVWAGGGVLRSGAWDELFQLAHVLDAPVTTTYMGKGAFPADHPLSAGFALDEAAFKELLEGADVVLAIGTELGAETTAQYGLSFSGTVIQIDAAQERLGATYPVQGIAGDARAILDDLLPRIEERDRNGGVRAAEVRDRVARGLAEQDRDLEQGLLETIRAAVPRDAVTAWDMT